MVTHGSVMQRPTHDQIRELTRSRQIILCIDTIKSVFFSHVAGPAYTRSARQPQGIDFDGGQDELHQSVAVVARVRHLAVRRQVHGPQERRAAGHSV